MLPLARFTLLLSHTFTSSPLLPSQPSLTQLPLLPPQPSLTQLPLLPQPSAMLETAAMVPPPQPSAMLETTAILPPPQPLLAAMPLPQLLPLPNTPLPPQ